MFSPLQGETAKKLLPLQAITDLSTIVYYQKGKLLFRSTAVIRICKDMAWYGVFLVPFLLIPRSIRDAVYNVIANNRKRLFPADAKCPVISASDRLRVLK